MRFLNVRSTILFFFLIISLPSFAAECFSDSPSKKNGTLGEMDANVSKLSSSQAKNINKLFKEFNGIWTGIGNYLACEGDRSSPKEGHIAFDLDGKVESKTDNIRISADLKAKGSNSTKPVSMRMFIVDDYLRHNTENKSGDIEIINVKNNLIHYLKKYRATSGSAETMEEQVVILRKVRSEFVLEQRHYKGGQMFGKELWVFRK
jgi:hypothetical protein